MVISLITWILLGNEHEIVPFRWKPWIVCSISRAHCFHKRGSHINYPVSDILAYWSCCIKQRINKVITRSYSWEPEKLRQYELSGRIKMKRCEPASVLRHRHFSCSLHTTHIFHQSAPLILFFQPPYVDDIAWTKLRSFYVPYKKTKGCGVKKTLYNSIDVVANSNISRNTDILKSSLLFTVPPDTFLVSTSTLILPTLSPRQTHAIRHLILQQILAATNPYPTAFPYWNGMVLHFYQQQESSTTKTVHKVINKGLKAYV